MQLVSADTEKLFILHLELNFFFFLKSWKLNKETSNYISSTLNLTKNHIKIVLKTKQRNLQYFFQHELNHCHEDLCPNTNQYVSSFKIPLNGILHLWHVKYPPGREICHGIWSIRNNSQAIVPSVLGAGQFCYLVLSAWLVVIIPWFIASWLSKLNQQKQNYLMYSNWRGQLNKTKIQYKKLFTNNKKIISFLTILLFDIYKMLYMTGQLLIYCWYKSMLRVF